MKTWSRRCLTVLMYVTVFVAVSFILDMLTGDKPEDFDIADKAITGLLAGIIFLLITLYEKKKFK